MYTYYRLTKYENPTFRLDDGFETIIVQINPDSIVILEDNYPNVEVQETTEEDFKLLFKGHMFYPTLKYLI